MAGIGFRLRALGQQGSLVAPVASMGHAAIVAAGPWLFTVGALAAIGILTAEHLSPSSIDAFRLIIINAFAISLICSAPIVLVAARLVGDALYARTVGQIRPVFLAASVLSAGAALVTALFFHLVVYGLPPAVAIPAASCCALTALVWVSLAFCSAVRDYSGITQSFVLGLVPAMVAAVLIGRWGGVWTDMVWAFNGGLLIVLTGVTSRVLVTFPQPVASLSAAMRAFGAGVARYPSLALAGLLGAVAIWIDKWVMWSGPAGVRHELGFVHAPLYDSVIFAAHLTIIPALALFVSCVETAFYARYRSYYAAIQGHATLGQIEAQAEVLRRTTLASLGHITLAQTAICLVVVIAAPTIVQSSGLFYQQVGVLRLGTLGALFQFVFFAATSLLLFFDRCAHVLALQAAFLVLQGALAQLTIEIGTAYYGLGYLVACVVCATLAFVALERTMADLTFITFCQPPGRGAWSRLRLNLHRLLGAKPLTAKSE